jgi:ribonuclease HI
MEQVIPASELFLFCDGSVHQASATGCGAYFVTDTLSRPSPDQVRTRLFPQTSSTRLELQTLLWALEQNQSAAPITVFTDSQNSLGLLARRQRLEAQNFCSAKGLELNNADLYRAFFALIDRMDVRIEKVKGHASNSDKTLIESLFAVVDQAARRQSRLLRTLNSGLQRP